MRPAVGGEPAIRLAHGVHLLGPLEGLGVVENEVDRFAGSIDAVQRTQRDALKHTGLLPVAAPEELAVVGPLAVIAKQGVESFEGVFGTHGDDRHQAPEVRLGGLGKRTRVRTK